MSEFSRQRMEDKNVLVRENSMLKVPEAGMRFMYLMNEKKAV